MFQRILPAYFADPRFPIPKELVEGKLNCEVFAAIWESTRGLDTASQLAALEVPTLVLMGDGDPLGLDMARATVAALPASKAELVVLPRCGHFPWIECPTPLFEAVRPFLARVTGASP
jgi:proline iminopeptidase